MSGIPVLIVIYIELTSPGFFGSSVYNADRTDADDGLPCSLSRFMLAG